MRPYLPASWGEMRDSGWSRAPPPTDGREHAGHKEFPLSRRPPRMARWRGRCRGWPIGYPRHAPVPVEDRRGCRCGGSAELCSRRHLGVGEYMRDLLSRNGLFPSREKLRESRSPSLGSHRPLRGAIPDRLPRSWLSRDRLFLLRGRTRGVRWARRQRKLLRQRGRPCDGSRVCLSREQLWLLSLSILPPQDLLRRVCRPRRFSLWSDLESCKGIHDFDRLVASERSLWLRTVGVAGLTTHVSR